MKDAWKSWRLEQHGTPAQLLVDRLEKHLASRSPRRQHILSIWEATFVGPIVVTAMGISCQKTARSASTGET
jgi:hypothetical protein